MFKGLVYALISGTAYGLLAIIIKLGYRCGIAAGELLAYRFLGGAAILAVYLLIRKPRLLRAGPRTLAKAALLGPLFFGLQSTLYFQALTLIPASTSALILYVYPLAVTLLSVAFFRQRPDKAGVIALALVSAGCACVFSDAFASRISGTGMLLAVGAMLVYSLYLVAIQSLLKGEEPLSVTFYALFWAGIFFTALHGPRPLSALDPRQLAVVAAIALVPCAVAIACLYQAIALIGSAQTSVYSTIEPVVTVIAAALVLGEHLRAFQVAGMALIVLGIVYPHRDAIQGRAKGDIKGHADNR